MAKKTDSVNISKKVIAGIAPVIAICAVLFAKDKIGEVFLFLIGVGVGIFIGINLKNK
jgi:hypothetical protein